MPTHSGREFDKVTKVTLVWSNSRKLETSKPLSRGVRTGLPSNMLRGGYVPRINQVVNKVKQIKQPHVK